MNSKEFVSQPNLSAARARKGPKSAAFGLIWKGEILDESWF